ncbi:hypothetical protein Bbelb_295960 [Branchiostoma belcheri]|nr:hypothetical protein Bbelb_295960 [Branchiostoma belcheri]
MLHLSNSQAAELVERLYGLDVESVTDLDSYGDYNFHVKVSGVHEGHHGYVLKVMNAEDSRDEEQITAQTAMMTFLSTRGFPVQRLQQNRWGKVMSLETFQWKQHGTQVSSDHNVRLMTYLPGILGSDVTFDSKSLLAAGVYLARLHQTLQDFHHPGLQRPNFKWNLRNVCAIRQYLHVLPRAEDRDVVNKALDLFSETVLSRMEDLPQGPIHADFRSENILVREKTTNSAEGRYEICGLLDFGDATWNPVVFDVAISLLNLMLATEQDPIAYSGYFLRGFESVRPLTSAEWDVLYPCVVGVACQLYVLNQHSISVDPGRAPYILKECGRIKETLGLLVETPKPEFDKQMLGRY